MIEPLNRYHSSLAPAASSRMRAVAAMLIAIACLGIRWPLLAHPGFKQDQVFFLHWANLAERGGVAAVYETSANGKPWCNYPPLYPYILRGLAGVYRVGTGESLDREAISDVIEGRSSPRAAAATALFKMPAVIADGLTCALLVLWLSRRIALRTAISVAASYAVMPAVIFDSAVWGQVDSIPTLFALIALECTTRRRWTWVGAFAALAMLAKPQAMIFVPLFVIASIYAGAPRASFALVRLAAGAAAVCLVVLAPLWSVRSGIEMAFTDAASHYPFVHLNGFSTWFLANPLPAPRLEALAQHYRRDDVPIFWTITPRFMGFAAMWVFFFVTLFLVGRLRATDLTIRYAARILPLAFVVVCTQMHERYLIPALAYWAWAYRATWNWWIGWVVIGAVSFLNLLWVWDQPPASSLVASLADWTRSSPGGIATGVYCAIALVIVLLMSLTGMGGRSLRKEITA